MDGEIHELFYPVPACDGPFARLCSTRDAVYDMKRRRISDAQVADICDSVARWHRQAFLSIIDMHSRDNHEPSHWMRSRVAEMGQRAVAGRVEFCPHLGVGSPVMMALWRPDLAVCLACSPQLWSGMRGTPDDGTCDRCGASDPDGVYGGALLLGAVLLAFGLCDGCAAREGMST